MPNLKTHEELWVVLIALLAAMLLASHQVPHFSLVGNYAYWFCRVFIEASLFIGVLFAAERYLDHLLPKWGVFALAIAGSLVPFVLAITAFDLIVGLPELGLNEASAGQESTATAFAYELIYLLDNHLALSLLLLLPRLQRTLFDLPVAASNSPSGETSSTKSPNTFLESLDPPLQGDLQSVEAQEHYVQVISSEESRLVLYRFSDVVRQLPDSAGIQIHRSHWVAHTAVKELLIQGQAMKLELQDGRRIPVSRSFRHAVENLFAKR